MIKYKIMERYKDGYKFLFHERRYYFKDGDIVSAVKRLGYEGYKKDGSKKLYRTGIHVIETEELCRKYFQLFKNKENKVIIKCQTWDIRKKPNGRPGVYLADRIKIIGDIKEKK